MKITMREVLAGFIGLLLFGAVGGIGLAQEMKGMTPVPQATPSVEDQLKVLQEEFKALRKGLIELKLARGRQMPMGPRRMPGPPRMRGRRMGQMMRQMGPGQMSGTPQQMGQMMSQMGGCSIMGMMGQMTNMGGMPPQSGT